MEEVQTTQGFSQFFAYSASQGVFANFDSGIGSNPKKIGFAEFLDCIAGARNTVWHGLSSNDSLKVFRGCHNYDTHDSECGYKMYQLAGMLQKGFDSPTAKRRRQ